MKHFLPFPCPCFSTSFFFFFFFALSLYPVCCLESSCVCDKHLRSSEMQCLLLFYFPTPISLLFPPSFLFDVLLLVFIPCKAQFFFFLYSELNGTCFSFGGAGFFSYSFCEPVMNFHCSVCCVEREKKRIKLGVLVSFFF